MSRIIYCDVSTAPIEGVVDFIEDADAPENYKNPDAIAKFKAEAKQKAIAKAALDPDLCRITGIGLAANKAELDTFSAYLCQDEDKEKFAIQAFAQEIGQLHDQPPAMLVGFNALRFDWPVLMRRARYLGVKLTINIDRYRGFNLDLSDAITNKGQLTSKSLAFYVKRLGWTDLSKPLSGEEEARIFEHERWDDLAASLRHDVEAVKRLHQWWGQ